MGIISFIGKSFTEDENFQYYFFEKPNPLCPKTCPLFGTCYPFKPNRVYKLTKIRQKEMKCKHNLHKEPMVLVEFEEMPIDVSMVSRNIFINAVSSYSPITCDVEECPHYHNCVPPLPVLKEGTKIKIQEKLEKIRDCVKNKDLTIVSVKKV